MNRPIPRMWNNHDPGQMGRIIIDSLMPLENDELDLALAAYDPERCENRRWSVYDLYQLNMLCYMVLGWMRANKQ